MNELNRREQLAPEVINLIIEAVHLQSLNRAEINLTTPLTQGGLNLDSIDILEIVIAVEHRFGLKVTDAETGKKYFQSIGTVVDFILEKKVTP